MPGPLEGIRVFDMTHAGVGPWATMLLATMGANVVKIENEKEWSQRQGAGPHYGGVAVIYMACHVGKRSAFIDLKSPEGQGLAWRLLKDADVFVENMKVGTADRLGLSYEAVSKRNPGIVYANCPGWGSKGPFKDWGSGDPTQQPFSGAVSITGKQDGDGELIRWYALHDFNASSYITTTVLLGLLHRQRAGNGLRSENPQTSASIAIQTSRIAEFLATGVDVPRMGSATTTTVPHRAFLCQDKRWLAVGVITDQQWRGLCKALKDNDLLEDTRFSTNPGRVQHREEVEDRLQAMFKTLPARWWTIQLRKQKVPVSFFYDYETIPDHPQIKANKMIVNLKYSKAGTLPFANLPFQLSKTPVGLIGGPWPGEHTDEVFTKGWGKDGAPRAKGYFGPRGPMQKGVLDGVTVVDMTQGLAGPYASLMLADAGARVIKIEPPEGDYSRAWGPPMVDGVSATFFHLNRNKEGSRLDIRKKGDSQKLLELLKVADIFIEEEGQGRMKRLGLSQEDVKKINPGLVYCTITPHGTKGPWRNQPASELTLQAMSDYPNTLGVVGEEPVRMGPDMASLGTSLYATHGVLGALYHKWRTGEGQHVTVNMLGTLVHQESSTFTGMVNPDDWEGYAGCYWKPPDTGYKVKDGRIGLSPVRKQEDFLELLKALGMEAYLEHPLFKHPPTALMGRPGSPTSIAAQVKPIWEKTFEKWNANDLINLLNKFGSNSGVVNTYKTLFEHPQTQALEMLKEYHDSKLGKLRFVRSPWTLDGVPEASPQPYKES